MQVEMVTATKVRAGLAVGHKPRARSKFQMKTSFEKAKKVHKQTT